MLASAYNLLHHRDNRPTPFERLLLRDRAVVCTALLILILLAWFYVGRFATNVQLAGVDSIGTRIVSTGTTIAATPIFRPWSGAEFGFIFTMWAAMMVAMMLPSATPMVLRYAWIGRATAFDTVCRHRRTMGA